MVGASIADCNLEDIEKELKEVEAYKEKLNERKAVLEAAQLNLKSDLYYEIRNVEPDTVYYCSGGMVEVQDGSGTIGYSKTQFALIKHAIFRTFHRFSGAGGWVEGLTFDIADMKRGLMPITIEEISVDDYCKVKSDIKERL